MKVVHLDVKRKQVNPLSTTTLDQTLERYCRFFEQLDPDNFDLFPGFYNYRVRYSSPEYDVHGPDRIRAIFEYLVSRCGAPRLIIRDYAVSGQHGFVYWKFLSDSTQKRPKVVTGISRIKFDGYGRVISHRDIWDAKTAQINRRQRFSEWWNSKVLQRPQKKRAAPPKEFHGKPPF